MNDEITITIKYDFESTIVEGSNGRKWRFSPNILDETKIAAIVFQTIFEKYRRLILEHLGFTIKLTINTKV